MNSTVPKTTAPHNIRTAHPLSSHIGNRGQQDAEYGDCSTDGHVVSVASLEGPSFLVTDRRGDRNNPPTLEVVTTIAVHCRRWINQATVGAFHRGAILFVMTAPSRSSDVPRRLTKSCDQIAAAVNDRDDAEALARQSVDDAIASHDQFSEMGVSVLGNDASQPRMPAKAFNGADNPGRGRFSIRQRVSTDELDKLTQVIPGSYRPADLSHFARLRLTAPCETVRPSLSSRSPRSTRCRK